LLPALPRQIAAEPDHHGPTSRTSRREHQQRNAALPIARCGFSWLAFGDISPATAVTSSMSVSRSWRGHWAIKIQRLSESGFAAVIDGLFRVEPAPAGRPLIRKFLTLPVDLSRL